MSSGRDRRTPRPPPTRHGVLLAIMGVAAPFADPLRVDAGTIVPMLAASAVCGALASLPTKKHGGALHPAALNAPAMLRSKILGARAPEPFAHRRLETF